MSYSTIPTNYKKLVSTIIVLINIVFISCVNSQASDFKRIEIHPMHVGVFTEVGTQQFVAFGITHNGSALNITDKVSWKSSNTNYIKIDSMGLATINPGVTSGQVKITCTYPKQSSGLTSIVGSLLRPSYTVTASVDGSADYGDIGPDGDSSIKSGNRLTLDLYPTLDLTDDSSYEVVAGNVSGSCPVGSVASNYSQYITGPISEDCTVVIPFSTKPEISPTLVGETTGESIEPDGSSSVYVFTGASQSFTLSPSENRGVSKDFTTTNCIGASLTYTGHHDNTLIVGPITEDCGVEVHFEALPTYPVTSSFTGSGSITPDSSDPVQKWQTKSFMIEPDGGFILSNISGSCPAGTLTPVTASTYTYLTGEIIGPCEVIANFTDNTVTVEHTVSGGNGTVIHTNGSAIYAIGESAEFTLTPNPGYIGSLVLDGDGCGVGGGFSNNNTIYTTASLTQDCTVDFAFNQIMYTMSVTIYGDGGVYTHTIVEIPVPIPDPDGEIFCYSNPADNPDECTEGYSKGTTVTLYAQENTLSGSSFVNWSGCTSTNEKECTVTMDNHKDITATFTD